MATQKSNRESEWGGHATTWPVKGKRRLRLDAIQRRFNAIKRGAAIIPERMISDVAYIKIPVVKKVEEVKKAVKPFAKAA